VKKTGIKPFSHVLSVMLLLGLFVIGYMPRCGKYWEVVQVIICRLFDARRAFYWKKLEQNQL